MSHSRKRTPAFPRTIPWHPAFVQAIKLELEAYRDALEFIAEYRLTSEPLEIDVVIVKKDPDLVIEKNIARIFRQVNILEYKSPEDYFSVHDFYKVLSYAFLYAALHKIAVEDMTISIIETRYPRDLFAYLRNTYHDGILEESPGIYRIAGYPLAIQVIESKKLPAGENLWLKGLAKDLNATEAGLILEESRKRGKKAEAELAAYLYALINANIQTMREVLNMAKEKLPFDRWVEETGLAAKWEAQGKAQGVAIGEARGVVRGKKDGLATAVALLKQGCTVEDLERMIPDIPG
jgi:hypothetical protein